MTLSSQSASNVTEDQSIDSRKNEIYDSASSMKQGVAWAVFMRWTMRLIGLFSTLILARVLSPEDFGIAAMGMLVLHFLFEVSEFGTEMHLIRAKEINRVNCDTAWTITLLQGVLTSVVLAALASPAAIYFKEPRVVEVMYVLALAALIGGFENIGPVLLRRDLQFARDFRFNVYKKILVFCTTIISALVLRNYWALVLGHLAGTIAGVVLSYVVHSYRPRWSLGYAREYITFAMAIIPLRVATTLRGMISSFLVAGLGNASVLGSFRVAGDLSSLFTREIVTPMGRGLLPNYTRLADRPEELSGMYRKVLSMVALVCIPAGVGVSAIADDLVLVLLGDQWGFAAMLMKYLAIGAAIFAVSQAMVNQILVATGRERSAAVLAWVRLGITFPILWAGFELGGAPGIAKASIVASLVCLPVIYNETRRAVMLPLFALMGLLWRPIVAAVVMHFVVGTLYSSELEWAILRLFLESIIGALTFVGVMVVLWLVSGRPRGAESIAFGVATQLLSAARDRILR
ncbi:MAG: oligosaccharide flippase family protein [Chromatocurvus sp.]